MNKMDKLQEILNGRGVEYGPFTNHAEITQRLKTAIAAAMNENCAAFRPDCRESLDMIAHKIGRIVNGNPDNEDSWRDIAGYATLVADRIARGPDNSGALPASPESRSANVADGVGGYAPHPGHTSTLLPLSPGTYRIQEGCYIGSFNPSAPLGSGIFEVRSIHS